MTRIISPLLLGFRQLDDPVFVGVLLRSVAWTFVCFAAFLMLALWLTAHALAWFPHLPGWLHWIAALLGTAGAIVLAIWFFLPIATAIGTLFIERVAAAVERRFYPALPAAAGASVSAQLWDACAVGTRLLALSLLALILAFLLPGVGAILGWVISAWAIGRGFFVAVAMRRMGLREAQALHRTRRVQTLAIGGVLALAGLIPPLNLLVPVIGVAAMVHVVHARE